MSWRTPSDGLVRLPKPLFPVYRIVRPVRLAWKYFRLALGVRPRGTPRRPYLDAIMALAYPQYIRQLPGLQAVVRRDADQAETGNRQTHDRTAAVSHKEGCCNPFAACGLGSADIGAGCRLHAEESGKN